MKQRTFLSTPTGHLHLTESKPLLSKPNNTHRYYTHGTLSESRHLSLFIFLSSSKCARAGQWKTGIKRLCKSNKENVSGRDIQNVLCGAMNCKQSPKWCITWYKERTTAVTGCRQYYCIVGYSNRLEKLALQTFCKVERETEKLHIFGIRVNSRNI